MPAETTETSVMPTAGDENGAADFDPKVDEATIKFLPEKKENYGATADAGEDAELGGARRESEVFIGLTKEELEPYATDPFWVRVRCGLFALFVFAWVAILVAATLIVIFSPKCPPVPHQEWHQREVIYNIYPRSFQDTNGDGIGDIQGIIQRLDYLSEIGVKALWLSSIYESPRKNGGQDVSDHKAIDSNYGTLGDFKRLVRLLKKRGMKLLMDFIPNHTSDEHKWFLESAEGGADNEFANYFVWSDPASGGGNPPNNWLGVSGGSAWTKSNGRGQYYLHQLHRSEPELNLRNEKVQKELMDILTYWLDVGVDGFVVRNAEYLVEDENLEDEPASGQGSAGEYVSLVHNHTTNQPENFPLVYQWQELLDNVSIKTEKFRVMLADAGNSAYTVQYMGTNNTRGAAFTVNKNLLAMTSDTTGKDIKKLVADWLKMMNPYRWTTWLLGDEDASRAASRLGRDDVNIANMLQLLLPGTAVVYYGNEIGMVDGTVPSIDGRDSHPNWTEAEYSLQSHDKYRTPMQWDGTVSAGFSNVTSWVPVPADYELHSVKAQRSAGVGKSNLEVFEELTELRSESSFLWGDLVWNIVDDSVVSFVRKSTGFPGYLVILNFGNVRTLVECHSQDPVNVPAEGEVALTSANFQHDDFKIGTRLMMDKLVIGPRQGLVFKLDFE